MRKLLLASALALACTGAALADRLDRRIIVLNNSSSTVVSVWGSNRDTNDWEEDVLGTDVIRSGKAATIDFDDGSGYCIFDLKALMSSGEEFVQWRVNVCTVETWTISD